MAAAVEDLRRGPERFARCIGDRHLMLRADFGLIQSRYLVEGRIDLEEDFFGLLDLLLHLLSFGEQAPHLQLLR